MLDGRVGGHTLVTVGVIPCMRVWWEPRILLVLEMGWEDKGKVTFEYIRNFCKTICTTCWKLLSSFHVNQGWGGKTRVQLLLRIFKMSVKWHVHVPPAQGWSGKTRIKSLLRISEMSVKHHVPPATIFFSPSLVCWNVFNPSDYSC